MGNPAYNLTLQLIRNFCGLKDFDSVHTVTSDGSPSGPRHHLTFATRNVLDTAADIASFAMIRGAKCICFTRTRQGII